MCGLVDRRKKKKKRNEISIALGPFSAWACSLGFVQPRICEMLLICAQGGPLSRVPSGDGNVAGLVQ